MNQKVYTSKVWLQLKIQQRKSLQQIADEAGVSTDTIRRFLAKHGLRI